MKKRYLFPVLLLTLLFVAVFPAQAQLPEPVRRVPIVPPNWNFEGLKIEYQRVNTMIEDQVATTHIDQLFVNDNDWMLEGVYLFPLPAGATVSELTMWVDGVPIESKILEADEARQIYDEIVRQWRDPALLEYVGSSAIQANVFPIPPHDERRIEIEYSQILPAENGLIHYVYPQSTNLYSNSPLDNQNIRVEVKSDEEIRTIYSPSHQVSIDRDGDYRAVVGYEGINVTPDEDFEVYYSVSQEDIGLNLISYREPGQDGFFLLLVAPSVDVDPGEVVKKDVILVVDNSGSMEGDKLSQAKEAALFVIDHLNEGDRFNIISFSTGVRSFARNLAPAGDAGDYESYIASMEALGGTNISQALLDAVAQADDARPTTVIFLTDGLATEGIIETPLIVDAVRQQTPENVRIFAFGVGDDVDTLLLDSITEGHGGATTYVRPGQQIDEAVSAFYAKVSTPVLADISIDFDDIIVEQVYPQNLPDLFAGTQLVLAGRYREGGPATITLSGEVNGREQTFVYDDNSFRQNGGDDFIPRLWATRAIGNLLSQIRLHGEDPELVQSVVNLSIRYGIITPYTSYLIEEDDIFTQTGRNTMFEETLQSFAAPAAVSGADAVSEAASESVMREAEVVVMPTVSFSSKDGEMISSDEVMQLVGSKTFVLRDSVWMDTAFDADNQERQEVGFASDVYFDLLSAAPELGQYLALGPQVLVVHQGQVYEIVEGPGQGSVTMPDANPPDENGGTNDRPKDKDKDPSQEDQQDKPALPFCGSALIIPIIFVAVVLIISKKMLPFA
jgi:Ca-activated chloride channel family protein